MGWGNDIILPVHTHWRNNFFSENSRQVLSLWRKVRTWCWRQEGGFCAELWFKDTALVEEYSSRYFVCIYQDDVGVWYQISPLKGQKKIHSLFVNRMHRYGQATQFSSNTSHFWRTKFRGKWNGLSHLFVLIIVVWIISNKEHGNIGFWSQVFPHPEVRFISPGSI